jgi:hypothetical protein
VSGQVTRVVDPVSLHKRELLFMPGPQTGIVTGLDGGRPDNRTHLTTWVDRGVMVVAWVTVGVIVLAGALFLWLRHTAGETGRPALNPAAYARSAPVRSADTADESWLGRQFAGVLEKAPWLIPVGSSVFDVCSVEAGAPDLFGGGTGYGFYCSRTGTRYYAYGPHAAARIRQLKRALRGLGWAGFESEPGQASLPTFSAQPAAAAPPAGKTGLEYSWAQRGDQVNLARDLGAVPSLVAPDLNTYLEATRPSRAAILGQLTPSHDHLLIISITADYATRPVA